jgi:predicted XRE-type DNA-binding protein
MRKSKKCDRKEAEISIKVGSDNIFKDLGFPEAEAVNLLARGELALEIRNVIQKNGWSQRRAASEMGVPQPRIAEIMSMRINHYSIDLLVKYLDKLGKRVSFVIEAKEDVA